MMQKIITNAQKTKGEIAGLACDVKSFSVTAFLKKYWISVFLTLIIMVLCFIDTAPLPEAPMTNFDKLVHLVMLMGLSGAIFFDSTGYLRRQIDIRWIFLGSFLFPTLLSGAIEIIQEYCTPTRSGDWMDFLFDGIGAFLGICVCFPINRMLKKKVDLSLPMEE
jgi:VanZ family protein